MSGGKLKLPVSRAGLTLCEWCDSFELDPEVVAVVEFCWIIDELNISDIDLT